MWRQQGWVLKIILSKMAANFDLDHSNLFNAEDSFSC